MTGYATAEAEFQPDPEEDELDNNGAPAVGLPPAHPPLASNAVRSTLPDLQAWLASRPFPPELLQLAAQAAPAAQRALDAMTALRAGAPLPALTAPDLQRVRDEVLLSTGLYVPASCCLFVEGWSTLVKCLGRPDAEVSQVLSWLRTGYPLRFADPWAPARREQPGRAAKLQVLRQLIRQHAPQADARELLAGVPPQALQLPNMKSAATHQEFVTAEVAKLIASGALIPWDPAWGPPTVINPLGVAEKHGKLRLVGGFMYVNWFEHYQPFKYEQLSSLEDFLQPGDFMYLTDAKSGYHHIPVDPQYWRYLVVEWQGRRLCYPVLPFGLGSACFAYTQFMRVINRVTRKHGEECRQFIDDGLGAARTLLRARHWAAVRMILSTATGIFYSPNKCQWEPQQEAVYLGMEVHTNVIDGDFPGQHFCVFRVPDAKVTNLQQRVAQVLTSPSVPRRELAAVAGTLMSFKLAVPWAPLYLRHLYHLVSRGKEVSWNVPCELDAHSRADLQWVAHHLPAFNGARVKKTLRQQGLRLVVDAAERQIGAVVFDMCSGEQLAELVTPIAVPQLGASSLLREAVGVQTMTALAIQRFLPRLKHARLHVVNDNKGSMANFLNMRGTTFETFLPVKATYELALSQDVEISFEWRPRTDAEVQLADDLSKQVDWSDFALTSGPTRSISARPLPEPIAARLGRFSWGIPTLDALADRSNTKAAKFFSKRDCPGSAGTDGYAQRWPVHVAGRRQLVWLFPGPVSNAANAIRKLQEERCDAVLIVPSRSRQSWVGSLHHLPIVDEIHLGYRRGLYEPGAAAPAALRSRPPVVPLTAYFVTWS